MNLDPSARRLAHLAGRPLWRVAVYYALVVGVMAVLAALVPAARPLLNAPLPGGAPEALGSSAAAAGRVVLEAVVSLASACLLMLPVTWVYVLTRRKKGFDQSIVQTLIILPLVVAGVILLVHESTALAFSLGGIVGAVAFRNRLRDTKDTIFIFLAIVIGVAAGVHALLIGATISVSFNAVALVMWWTDFGRVGALLEGPPAERRLRRARELAGRNSGFISMVDRELLQSMPPEQLAVLAERARMREHAAAAKAEIDDEGKGRREWTLRLEVIGTTAEGRHIAEALLQTMTKGCRFMGARTTDDGRELLKYAVRLKKNADRADFIGRLRAAAGAAVLKADLSRPRPD
jgi:uncharacterized protein DUF4956